MRLSFGAQLSVVVAALTAYAGWVYLHARSDAPGPATEAGACADKAPYGAPRVVGSPAAGLGELRTVCRVGYLLGHSGVTRTPLWVAEHLTVEALGGHEARTNDFKEDPEIPAGERATLEDYRASGYDRGHMAPAADFSKSNVAMADSFFLSNIVPQVPDNNRGPWAQLESHVRTVTRRAGDTYVMTGPVFGATSKRIGRGGVRVPEQLFKLQYDRGSGKLGAWLLPNQAFAKDKWSAYCTSGAVIQQVTGLDFFPAMPAAHKQLLLAQHCAM